MNKIKLVLVGIIIILFVLPNLANASVDEYEVVKDNMNQPKTLNDAVDEIKQMIEAGRSRWEIAKRVATIADVQITNMNENLGESMSWKWFISIPASIPGELDKSSCLWTKKERNFNIWRDAPACLGRGADAQYDVTADWVWHSRAGNCAEHAALVYYLLKEAGEEDIHIFTAPHRGDDGHQFVVWGLGCKKDPNKLESWTDDVIIPDSWQHKVLRRQAVLNNEYCAGGEGKYAKLSDQTYNRDNKACGFVGNPCCKKISPCRNASNRVCIGDVCHNCGEKEGHPCCKDEKCNAGLECKDGKCVTKEERELEDTICLTQIPKEAIHHTENPKSDYWTLDRVRVGLYQEWFDEGKTQPHRRWCYNTKGKLHGLCVTWFNPDVTGGREQKWQERNYKNGTSDGSSKRWGINGNLLYEMTYLDGYLHGPYKTYHKNGKPLRDANYVNGKYDGKVTYYYDPNDPTKYKVSVYKNGELVDSKAY